MAKKRTDLKIPYSVSDFRAIRDEGLYYVDKTGYLAQMAQLRAGRRKAVLMKGDE